MGEVPKRKRSTVLIPLPLLGDALRLPPEVHIEHVYQDDQDRFTNCCKLILVGEGLPEECMTVGRPVQAVLRQEEVEEKQFVRIGHIDVVADPHVQPEVGKRVDA